MAPDDPTGFIGTDGSQPGNIVPGAGADIPSGLVNFTGDLGFGFSVDGAIAVTSGIRESQILADVAQVANTNLRESQLYADAATLENVPLYESQILADAALVETTNLRESQLYADVALLDIRKFLNADALVGLTWLIWTFRDGSQVVISDRELPDRFEYYLGFKSADVMRWQKIRRALSGFEGDPETADFAVTLDDTEGLWRQRDRDDQLVGSSIVVYQNTDEARRNEEVAEVVFRGVCRVTAPEGTFEFTAKFNDPFQARFTLANDDRQVPDRRLTADDFDNIRETLVSSSAEDYVVNGARTFLDPDPDGENSKMLVHNGTGIFAPGQKFTVGASLIVRTVTSATLTEPETEVVFTPALELGESMADGDAIVSIPSFTIESHANWAVPFPMGRVSDSKIVDGADAGDGRVIPVLVGDKVLGGRRGVEFVWGGWACHAPGGCPYEQLNFWNNPMDGAGTVYYADAPLPIPIGDLTTEAGSGGRIAIPGHALWSDLGLPATAWQEYNGRRYVNGYLFGIFRDWALGILPAPAVLGGVPFTVNGYGVTVNADGSGGVETDALMLYKKVVSQLMPPIAQSYQGGDSWVALDTFPDNPGLPMIDEESFLVAAAQGSVYVSGGFRWDGIVGYNNEAISRVDMIARCNLNAGVESGWRRTGPFFVDMFNTDLSSIDLEDELTYVLDIFSGTFKIDDRIAELYNLIPYRHSFDHANRAPDGWRSTLAEMNVFDARNGSSITTYGNIERPSPELLFHFIQGKNRDIDIDDYQQGSDTVEAILTLKLAMYSWLPHFPSFQTGPAAINYELGDTVPITHPEGLAPYVSAPQRVWRIDVDPSDQTGELEVFDRTMVDAA